MLFLVIYFRFCDYLRHARAINKFVETSYSVLENWNFNHLHPFNEIEKFVEKRSFILRWNANICCKPQGIKKQDDPKIRSSYLGTRTVRAELNQKLLKSTVTYGEKNLSLLKNKKNQIKRTRREEDPEIHSPNLKHQVHSNSAEQGRKLSTSITIKIRNLPLHQTKNKRRKEERKTNQIKKKKNEESKRKSAGCSRRRMLSIYSWPRFE